MNPKFAKGYLGSLICVLEQEFKLNLHYIHAQTGKYLGLMLQV